MSAWIVTARHIDFVVTALLSAEIVDEHRFARDPSALGRYLWEENHASVSARYNAQEPRPAYRYSQLTLPDLTTDLGLRYTRNALASYEYQSSEHAAWKESRARRWVDQCATGVEVTRGRYGYPEGPFDTRGWTVHGDYDPELALHEDYRVVR